MTLKSGDTATMWHEGSQSFYEVTVVQPLTVRDVLDEACAAGEHDQCSCGHAPTVEANHKTLSKEVA